MHSTSTVRLSKLLALAASAAAIGQPGEARAALTRAAAIAEARGIDLVPLADSYNVSLNCLVPWTEEEAPAAELFVSGSNLPIITCEDGSVLHLFEGASGIMIERLGGEALDYRLLSRGFWRDCELTEAVCFARDAWGC